MGVREQTRQQKFVKTVENLNSSHIKLDSSVIAITLKILSTKFKQFKLRTEIDEARKNFLPIHFSCAPLVSNLNLNSIVVFPTLLIYDEPGRKIS